MATQAQTLETRCPNAVRANKVLGRGRFAVLGCKEGDGVRRVYLSETELERNSRLWRFDRIGCRCEGADCVQDHICLTFEEEDNGR